MLDFWSWSPARTLDPRVNYRFDTKSRKVIVERPDLHDLPGRSAAGANPRPLIR
jgi:hypothetical protein